MRSLSCAGDPGAAVQTVMYWSVSVLAVRVSTPTFRKVRVKVPVSPLGWAVDRGPWVDNNLAVLELQEDGGLSMRWLAGDVEGRASDDPVVKVVAEVDVPVNRPAQEPSPA